MDKMWAGRFSEPTAEETDRFNSSIAVDKVMYAADIKGSVYAGRAGNNSSLRCRTDYRGA